MEIDDGATQPTPVPCDYWTKVTMRCLNGGKKKHRVSEGCRPIFHPRNTSEFNVREAGFHELLLRYGNFKRIVDYSKVKGSLLHIIDNVTAPNGGLLSSLGFNLFPHVRASILSRSKLRAKCLRP